MDIALESESNGWDPPTSIPETTCLTWTTPVSGLRMGVLTVVWFIWGKGGHWGLIPGITLTHLTPQELLTIPTPSWRGVGVHAAGGFWGIRRVGFCFLQYLSSTLFDRIYLIKLALISFVMISFFDLAFKLKKERTGKLLTKVRY